MPDEVQAKLKELGGFQRALETVCHELAQTAMIVRPSTSANIVNTDTGEVPDTDGQHIFVLVKDGSDANRFLRVLADHCWLEGLGWHVISRDGKLLERSIVDVSLADANRLVFEANAECRAPLKAMPRPAVIHDGDVLDTKQAAPDLGANVRAEVLRLQSASMKSLEAEARKAHDKWVQDIIDAGVKRGLSPEAARRAAENIGKGVLRPNIELEFDDRGIGCITVGDLLADPQRFDHETLADPVEGINPAIGWGRNKAIFYADNLTIFAFTPNGDTLYSLRHDYASIEQALRAAKETSAQEVVPTLCRLLLMSDIEQGGSEEGLLIKLASKLSDVGVLAVKKDLKAARAKDAGETKSDGFIRGQDGKPLNTHGNIRVAIERLGVTLRHNSFLDVNEFSGLPPYKDGELEDQHGVRLCFLIDEQFHFLPTEALLERVITDICYTNAYHPVDVYLSALKWDGVSRIGSWIIDYLGVEDTPLNRAISKIILIAGVRRIKHPGTKFDQLPVLEGVQGNEKSTSVERLMPNPTWFTDALPLNADSKKTMEQTQGIWLAEIAELQGKTSKELDGIKAFLSRHTDRARKAYAHRPAAVPRQWIAFGTTNDDKYLQDNENRRFWPLKVATKKPIQLERLSADRDQLWAEAVVLEAQGESIVLPRDLWAAAGIEQKKRKVDNPYLDFLLEAYGGKEDGEPGWVSTVKVRELLNWKVGSHWKDKLFGEAMRELGFERRQVGSSNDPRGARGARFYDRGDYDQRTYVDITNAEVTAHSDRPF